MRTLVIGIDAACREVLQPLFEAGVTPRLRSVFGGGASGPLKSGIPPWTASAWPTIYTGKNPGKHGVFDMLAYDGYDWDVVNATHVRARPVWELLDRFGFSSVAVNVPVTHPPGSFDGALVPGFLAPNAPRCHPEGLLGEVRAEIGDYRVYPDDRALRAGNTESALRVLRMRGAAFRYLADRFDPDFGFVEFQQTDAVFHKRPGDREAVEAVYRTVDEQVGAILDELDPDNVLVVSDHGMGPYDDYEFRINEFLRERGFVTAKRGGQGMPAWTTIKEERLALDSPGPRGRRPLESRGRRLLEAGVAAAARVGVTTQRVADLLDSLGLAEAVGRRVPHGLLQAGSEQVDFPASRAYARSRSELGVRLNLEGREPDGTVPRSAYEAVRAELVEALESVRTPDGDPVFEAVGPREAFFEGPHVEDAPDVVTVPNGFEQLLSVQLAGDVFGEPTEPYNHKRHGIVAATGEDIDAEAGVEGAHILDVTPTVLATFDVPRGTEMDGRPLPVVADPGEREYPDYDATRTERTDSRRIEARLSELGYIE
ncbi:alkaline phosphatase family protein [Halorussus salilacus]|uniref:alkaline phosphatase family protein n=1 Tax=Halorussus salilacus TaxID=2953750 RepID=UPI00209FBD9B|nr:alkaline phosphatase family protein [Halorussus salilacus]USZ69209.1 alkaline phosphatase family protein [Halorussus salilacus]